MLQRVVCSRGRMVHESFFVGGSYFYAKINKYAKRRGILRISLEKSRKRPPLAKREMISITW